MYEDMIHLSRPISAKRARMSMGDRAAQFSAFAALSGYGDAVAETARLTEAERYLDESEQEALGRQLSFLAERIHTRPSVTVTYFLPDCRKTGGAYLRVTGRILRIDEYNRQLTLEDGTVIPFDHLQKLEQ